MTERAANTKPNLRKSPTYLTVSKDEWTNGVQLSIDDENGGYRIAGPKFNGSSKTLLKHKISERDIAEIRSYLAQATDGTMTAPQPAQSQVHRDPNFGEGEV